MNKPEILTIRFEVYPGDISEQYYPPMPNPGIEEMVQVVFTDGRWVVSGEVGGVPFAGAAESKNQAILNYLEARLDLPVSAARGEGNNS